MWLPPFGGLFEIMGETEKIRECFLFSQITHTHKMSLSLNTKPSRACTNSEMKAQKNDCKTVEDNEDITHTHDAKQN